MIRISYAFLFLALSFGFPMTVHAAEGSGVSGGAHGAPNGDLFDYWENEGTGADEVSEEFKPLDVAGVREILTAVGERIPGFEEALREALKKKWYLEPKPMERCPGGESLVLSDKTVAACQDVNQVRIYKPWYFQPVMVKKQGTQELEPSPERTARKKKGVVIHEFARGILILLGRSPSRTTELDLREITRVLTTLPLPPETELRDLVARLRFGQYFTRSEERAYEAAQRARAQAKEAADQAEKDRIKLGEARIDRVYAPFIEKMKEFDQVTARAVRLEVHHKALRDQAWARHNEILANRKANKQSEKAAHKQAQAEVWIPLKEEEKTMDYAGIEKQVQAIDAAVQEMLNEGEKENPELMESIRNQLDTMHIYVDRPSEWSTRFAKELDGDRIAHKNNL